MSAARFSIIPAWVVTHPDIKNTDLRVLCLLGTHTNKEGWCRRSQMVMAEELGFGRSTIQAALARLYEIGAVEKREVESANGRNSAHYYRVIHDRKLSDALISTFDEAETEEDIPSDDTPPAQPAGQGVPSQPGRACPASRAAINDTSLTDVSNEGERERGRDTGEEENHKSVERAFKRWFATWPTFVSDSEPEALRAWAGLSADERAKAAARSGEYLEAVKAAGRKNVCSAAVYLREKRWEKLSAVAAPAAEAAKAAPFGKAWMAARFLQLLQPMASLPRLTAFNEKLVREGGELGERTMRQHRERYGWPRVSDMHARAARFEGVSVRGDVAALGAGFEQVRAGSALFEAWRVFHLERGWPWLPDMGSHEWVYFPAGGPERFDDFAATIGGQGVAA